MANDDNQSSVGRPEVTPTAENVAVAVPEKAGLRKVFATCVKFTEAEYAKVKNMQLVTGLSIPTLLKKALLKREDLAQPAFAESEQRALITEINRQGNNVNQIAQKIHQGGLQSWGAEFNRLAIAYNELRRAIREKCGNN
jgi:hypothetical protein